jgi:fatty-acid desaturase
MIKFIRDNIENYRVTGQVPYVFAVLIPFHMLSLAGLYLAYASWEWWYLGAFFSGWIICGGLGAAVGLHRWIAHKSIEVRPFMRPVMHWIMVCACQGSAIWWAAQHRGYHHAHADQEKDLHSPKHGLWHSWQGWMWGIKHDSINLKYGVEYLRDESLVWHHKHYNKVVWITFAVLSAIDPMLGLWLFVIPAMFCLHSDSAVNTFCHLRWAGYRLYNTKDDSVNVPAIGWFAWGQGWHNNHHRNPRSFDFGTTVSGKWWEFDPCLLLVPLISPWSEVKRLWGNWWNGVNGANTAVPDASTSNK